MDGVDTMCRAELVLMCEKFSLDCGKTVAAMKYALKRHYETHPDGDDPAAKKAKKDPAGGTAAKPGHCALGAACPELHSLSHRMALVHDGYRDKPIKCRDGMGCAMLKDKAHLTKYAHEDDLDKVCKDGGDCPNLHDIDHRRAFEHPGFRAQPVECRDGLSCAKLKDKAHLYKYAHRCDGAAPAAAPAAPSAPPTPTPKPTPAPKPDSPKKPTAAAPGMPAKYAGKTLADFPLERAGEATLIEVEKDSEEFWDLEEKFAANMQGRNEDYVAKRIKAGKKPLRFILVGAERVVNETLEARYEFKKAELTELRGVKEVRDRVSFHGTHPKNLKSILKTGLLRFQHPLNPCKTQVDDGYFGTNKKGIYVSRYADYTLKYSNRVCAVEPGDDVKTVMFKTLPGKSMHIKKLSGAIDPTPGYDSHSSPTFLEWYLFDEAQACPNYVLKVKAVEDTRTAADDE